MEEERGGGREPAARQPEKKTEKSEFVKWEWNPFVDALGI